MEELLAGARPVATVGTGLMAGIFLAFSTSVLPGLRGRPAAEAVAATQAMNRAILNPLFLLVFLGTPVALVVVAVVAVVIDDRPVLRVAATVVYVAGSLLVTAAVNVPLNNRLDRREPASLPADELAVTWSSFVRRWNRWNYLRCAAAVVTMVLVVS